MDSLKIYLNSIRQYDVLSEAETTRRLSKIKKDKGKLINGNLKLAAGIAIEMSNAWPYVDVMDLISEANVSLMNVVDKFNPDKEVLFSTFATFCIRNDLIRYIKNNTKIVRMYTTRNQRIIFNHMSEIKKKLNKKGVTIEDVADEYDVDKYTLNMLTDPDCQDISIQDLKEGSCIIDSPEKIYIKNEVAEVLLGKIAAFRKTLNENELVIFDENIYEGDLSLAQIAEFLDLSRERVRQIRNNILIKAREWFDERDLNALIN
jgi:RNA polymerase sigma-32 factor